jgi:uncharacterized membrane protein
MIASIAILLFVVSIIVAIAMVLTLWTRKKTAHKAETNYRVFFIIGVIITPTGLTWMVVSFLTELDVTIGLPFFILGIVYLAIGLNNRDKWNKKAMIV